MKKRTIYISLFLIFIIGVVSLIGTFAIDSTITEGTSSKADYLFNIVLGDRTNRDILIPSYDSKIVDIKISNPNEFNMSYLLYLEGINSNISIINISDTEVSGVLNSKNTNLIKVFIQNNSSSDITVTIKDLVGFEKETLSLPSNSTAINKGVYYKSIVKSNNNDYGKVKPNIKLSTKSGTVKYNIVPNTGYKYKSTTCDGTVANNVLTISSITSNISCEVVFEPINIQVTLDLGGGAVETTYIGPNEYTYTVPYTSNYKIELWGAQGGGTSIGNGAYTSGNIDLSEKEKLYFYTGGMGFSNSTQVNTGGYNGGGYSGNWEGCNSYGGGGSTDVRLSDGSWNDASGLNTRIMVAAGGAGTVSCITTAAGHAGGLIGGDGTTNYSDYNTSSYLPKGSTQTEIGFAYETTVRQGGFGYAIQSNTSGWGGGGGGGYYGGSNGHGTTGSGGSSYISGHTGCVAIASSSSTTPKAGCITGTSDNSCSIHYSGKVFTNTVMIDGSGYAWTNTKGSLQQMPKLSGNYGSGIGNSGNGAARITLVGTASYTTAYNEKYGTLPTPTRDGYTFDGWYTGENGTGTKIDENTAISIASNHTIYAKWIRDVIVTYNYRNSIYNQDTSTWVFSGNNSHVDNNYSYNGTIAVSLSSSDQWTGVGIPLNDDKKQNTNYILSVKAYRTSDFSGYLRAYTPTHSSDGSVINWNHNISISTSDLPINTWKEYNYSFNSSTYANWYKINIDYDTTNQGPVYVSDIRLDEYENKTIPQGQKYGTMSTPTRTGYTFGGWYTGENGTGTKVDENTVISNTSDHTLYAKWTANTYTISYNLNGGTKGSSAPTSGTYGSTVTVSNPTRTNYTFTGWTVSGTGASMSGTSLKIGAGNITLTANWKANDTTKPTCSLSLSGSNISASYSDNVGVAYYGWSSSYSGTNSASKSISAGTHTFYVKDTSGNTNTCSITVASTSTSKSCNAEAIKSAKFGSANGCNVYSGTPSCTYVSGNTCSCVYTPYYSGSNYYYYCCPGGVSADWNNKLPSGLPSCTQSFSSDSYITTTYSCSSGYTKFNNSWCYK